MHYLNNCRILDERTQEPLLKQYRKNEIAQYEAKDKEAGQIGRITHLPTSTHLPIFKTCSSRTTIGTDSLAKQKVDTHFIPNNC